MILKIFLFIFFLLILILISFFTLYILIPSISKADNKNEDPLVPLTLSPIILPEEKKYIPYYYDALFYKVFGDDKDTSLLKNIIELSLGIKVKNIRILNGKMLADKYKNKVSYLDLYVELDDETKVGIEVNTNTEYYIKDRNLYFLAKCVAITPPIL